LVLEFYCFRRIGCFGTFVGLHFRCFRRIQVSDTLVIFVLGELGVLGEFSVLGDSDTF
jgi:hypothetical protein